MKRGLSLLIAVLMVAWALALSPTAAAAPKEKHPAGARHDTSVRIKPHRSTMLPRKTSRAAATVVEPPTSVDLTSWTVPVGDQGQVGSCVSWAIGYAMDGWYSRYQGRDASGTLFSPMYSYSQVHVADTPDGGGAYPSAVYGVGTDQGVDTQSDYVPQGNYDFTDLPTAAQKLNAASYKSGAFSWVFSAAPAGSGAIDAVKYSIANHQPVAFTFPVYSAFDNLSTANPRLEANEVDTSTYRGSHEVLAVGYDSLGVRIQNSWGTSWGDQGLAYLNWDFVTQYVSDASVSSGFLPATTVPSSPTSVKATPSGTTAVLRWAPPTSTGGSPVTGYKIARDGTDSAGVGSWSTTVTATTTSAQFTRLKPGTSYHLSVRAINAAGTGPAKTVTVVIPTTGASAPVR
jgi:hypothetical protein